MKIIFSGTIEIHEGQQPSVTGTTGNFSEWLRASRHLQNLTLNELAKLSGVSASHICKTEHGKREPSYRIAVKLKKALGEETNG